MKNNKHINNKIYMLLAMLLLLGISFVSAFSVSYPYMENKTLNLAQNSKITDLQFVLQNGGGATETISIKAQVVEGSEVASIIDQDSTYTVVPGDKVPVNLRITLPNNVTMGDSYNIKLEFSTVSSPSNDSMIGFGTAQDQDFTVVVGKKIVPEKQYNSTYLFLIIGILLVALIIVILMIRRKNKIPSKKR